MMQSNVTVGLPPCCQMIFFKRRSVPPAVLPRFRRFAPVFPEKRLELKSPKGWTKAEKLGDLVPELLSLRPPLRAL